MTTTVSAQPLAGKVALVTGASSGIGEATALALSMAGADVAVVARRGDRLKALSERIESAGGKVFAIEADIARVNSAQGLINDVLAYGKRLDIIVNNAGVMLLSPVSEARSEDWRQMIEVNLVALMELTRAALPHLKENKGHIVNVSSVAGRVANPGAAGYAATKFGVVAFSEALRREVYADKVRVTVIEPGMVETELGDHITNPGMRANLEERRATIEPLQPEDIAAAVLFAVTQPPRVNVNEILIRPTDQER